MSFSVRVEGVQRLQQVLRRLGPAAKAALRSGMFIEAETIMSMSQRLVPVDTGALKSTGHVQPPAEATGGVIVVSIGYGGVAAGYALKVHEDLTAYHKPPTQAKYLEQPTLERVAGMADRLAARIESRFGNL